MFLFQVAQVWNYKLDALRPIIFLEAVLFMLTLLLALNFNEFDIALPRQIVLEKDLYHSFIKNFQSETGIRQVSSLRSKIFGTVADNQMGTL